MLQKLKKLSLSSHLAIHFAMLVGGLLISLIVSYTDVDNMNLGVWAGLFLIVGGIVWQILFIRCPHCRSLLRVRGGIPKYCPECGKYIDKFH